MTSFFAAIWSVDRSLGQESNKIDCINWTSVALDIKFWMAKGQH
jgi:hypothetical protein